MSPSAGSATPKGMGEPPGSRSDPIGGASATSDVPPGSPLAEGEQSISRRKRAGRLLLPLLLVLLLVGAAITYKYWYNDAFFVATENARVAGPLIQVGALNAGRVENIAVDVGNWVERNQLVATVSLPSAVSVAQGVAKMGFLNTDDLKVEVRSPVAGIVIARQGNVGDTVAAGQPIVTIVDPGALWVTANIEETKVSRVRVGQPVEVHIDALNRTFRGRVQAITPATAATFSLLPQQNGSGNFIKVTQLIPVRIAVDTEGYTLPLGGSASVRIKVAEPQGWLLWRP